MFTQAKVTGLRESQNLCSHSVVKLHEATQMLVEVDYVREMIEKSYKYCVFFFCVPQLYLWGSPLLGEIFAYVTVF